MSKVFRMNQVDVTSASNILTGAPMRQLVQRLLHLQKGLLMVVKVPIRLHLLISLVHIVPDLAPFLA